jgi:hypothetical protein
MNVMARLIPKANRSAFIAIQRAQERYDSARRKAASAKTPASRKTAADQARRAETAHHAAMGRLPLTIQALARLKK